MYPFAIICLVSANKLVAIFDKNVDPKGIIGSQNSAHDLGVKNHRHDVSESAWSVVTYPFTIIYHGYNMVKEL